MLVICNLLWCAFENGRNKSAMVWCLHKCYPSGTFYHCFCRASGSGVGAV